MEKGDEESKREEGRGRQERWERRREKERRGGDRKRGEGKERRGERRRRGIRDACHCYCGGYHVILALLQDLFNNYDCDCVTGWEDKNCDVETNECINMPCMNGATCNVSHMQPFGVIQYADRTVDKNNMGTAGTCSHFCRTCSMPTTAHVPMGLLGRTARQTLTSVSPVPARMMPHVLTRSMATPAYVEQSSR